MHEPCLQNRDDSDRDDRGGGRGQHSASAHDSVHARVESANDHKLRFEKEWEPSWPVRLAMVPLAGQAEREFRLSVEAKDDASAVLVRASLQAGYVQGSKRYVALFLAASCLDHVPDCDEDSTCRAGACVSAKIDRAALAEMPCVTRGSNTGHACIVSRATGAAGTGPADDDAGSPEAGAEGGSGACADDQLLCSGQCVARDSTEHCGSCEVSCPADQTCVAGQCGCSGPGTHLCNKKCVADDAITSCGPSECTPCPTPRHGTALCDAGKCKASCEPGYLECEGQCVDTQSDDAHCGGCGNEFACGSDRVCHDGHCVACMENAMCKVSECRAGLTHCAQAVTCVDTGPVPDGAACGNSASCHAGRCTCGSNRSGTGGTFAPCAGAENCQASHACVDEHGSGQFICRPLCETNDDCAEVRAQYPNYPNIVCSAAICSNGKDPGMRVCVEEDSWLAPSYESSACCGGIGSGTISAMGCSDGTREAFTDTNKFPAIAGCQANWPESSMRAPATGHACGYGSGKCSVPADACGTGWHVCGAPPYGPTDISNKVTVDQCDAQIGAFAAAIGDRTCECGQQQYGAACCGTGCTQSHGNCVFPNHTSWFGVWDGKGGVGLCNSLIGSILGQGVLCCRGFPANPGP